VQWPILRAGFLYDDFLHLFEINNLGPTTFLLTPHGGHFYLVRNLVFLSLYELFGLWTRPYFAAVLLTHLVNVWLLFRLILGMTGDRLPALFGATLWGTALVQRGVLGWYTAHGHALATTALLWLLCELVRAGRSGAAIERRRVLLWYLVAVLGAACFGLGLAFAMAVPVVAWVLLPAQQRVVARSLIPLLLLIPGIYLLYLSAFHAVVPTAGSELLLATQLRAPLVILQMLQELVADGLSELFAGNFGSPPENVRALIAGLYVIAIGSIAVVDPPRRRPLLALHLLVVTAYGLIATGRSFLHAGMGASLEFLARQPRYHYGATALIAAATSVALAGLLARWRRSGTVLIAGALTLTCAAAAPRWQIPGDYNDARIELALLRRKIGERIQSEPIGTDVCIANQHFASIGWAGAGNPAVFPRWAAVFVILYPDNTVEGRRVWFVESNRAVVQAARALSGSRASRLLVEPGQAPCVAPPASERRESGEAKP
jgi:hypothetical protein